MAKAVRACKRRKCEAVISNTLWRRGSGRRTPQERKHTDVRDANVLWDEETERAMVIDFEQAVLAERPRQALAPVVPNKRARRTGVDTNTAAGKPKSNVTQIGSKCRMIFWRPR